MNILITGTSSGIGYGLAKEYLGLGHRVYGISRKANEELSEYSNFFYKSLDLKIFDQVENDIPEFLNNTNYLDLIVLNAGILPRIGDMRETPLDHIKDVFDINVWANKVLLDCIAKTGKPLHQVVAVSSGAAVSGARGWNAYSLSKATLNMLVQLYAAEMPETHFTALAPGIIDTNMQDHIYNLPEDERFPVLAKLRKAKGTPDMPDPVKASKMLAQKIDQVKDHPSGSFLDVRTM